MPLVYFMSYKISAVDSKGAMFSFSQLKQMVNETMGLFLGVLSHMCVASIIALILLHTIHIYNSGCSSCYTKKKKNAETCGLGKKFPNMCLHRDCPCAAATPHH